tara:strand:+ start:709 stop:885 length:177 start_codon:yes stop_codon:yes gene_type:complete
MGKKDVQLGTKGSTKLSMKQVNVFELQRQQFEQFLLSLLYEICGNMLSENQLKKSLDD